MVLEAEFYFTVQLISDRCPHLQNTTCEITDNKESLKEFCSIIKEWYSSVTSSQGCICHGNHIQTKPREGCNVDEISVDNSSVTMQNTCTSKDATHCINDSCLSVRQGAISKYNSTIWNLQIGNKTNLGDSASSFGGNTHSCYRVCNKDVANCDRECLIDGDACKSTESECSKASDETNVKLPSFCDDKNGWNKCNPVLNSQSVESPGIGYGCNGESRRRDHDIDFKNWSDMEQTSDFQDTNSTNQSTSSSSAAFDENTSNCNQHNKGNSSYLGLNNWEGNSSDLGLNNSQRNSSDLGLNNSESNSSDLSLNTRGDVCYPAVCLIGLHCCGDLSPVMLRYFTQLYCIKAVCFVSCCYHRMAVSGKWYH